jgi:hypothetical protein
MPSWLPLELIPRKDLFHLPFILLKCIVQGDLSLPFHTSTYPALCSLITPVLILSISLCCHIIQQLTVHYIILPSHIHGRFQYFFLSITHILSYRHANTVLRLFLPFSLLLFFHHLFDLAIVFSISLLFTKDQLSVSLICSIHILLSNSLTSALIFIIPFHILSFALIFFCFLKVWGVSDYSSDLSLIFWYSYSKL